MTQVETKTQHTAKTIADAQVDTETGMKEQAHTGCGGGRKKWLMVVVFFVFVAVVVVSATVALVWTGTVSVHAAKRVRPALVSNHTMSGPGMQDIKAEIDHLLETAPLHGNSSELYLELPLWDKDKGKDVEVVNISVQVRVAPLADLLEGDHHFFPSHSKSVHTTSSMLYLFERHDTSQDDEVYSSGVLECTGMGGGGHDAESSPACHIEREHSGPGRRLCWSQVWEVVCMPFYICGGESGKDVDYSCALEDPFDYDNGQQACCPYTNQVWCAWVAIRIWRSVSSCFPADSLVETPIGQKPVSELRVGDQVLTPSGFDTVYFNTHAEEAMPLPYLRFTLSTGEVSEASPGHYIMADGDYRLARNVAPGMALQRKGGGWGSVLQIERVVRPGAFNPLTLSGKIIVDGIVWSVWSDWIAEGLLPEAWTPGAYQLIFLPIRALFHVAPRLVAELVEEYRDMGSLGEFAPLTILAKVAELLRRPSVMSTGTPAPSPAPTPAPGLRKVPWVLGLDADGPGAAGLKVAFGARSNQQISSVTKPPMADLEQTEDFCQDCCALGGNDRANNLTIQLGSSSYGFSHEEINELLAECKAKASALREVEVKALAFVSSVDVFLAQQLALREQISGKLQAFREALAGKELKSSGSPRLALQDVLDSHEVLRGALTTDLNLFPEFGTRCNTSVVAEGSQTTTLANDLLCDLEAPEP